MLGYSDRSPRFIIEGDVMEFAELLVSMQDALDRTDLDVPPPPSPLRNLETFSSLDGTLVIDGSNEIYKKVGSMEKGQSIPAQMLGCTGAPDEPHTRRHSWPSDVET
jgi:hypothetical protein